MSFVPRPHWRSLHLFKQRGRSLLFVQLTRLMHPCRTAGCRNIGVTAVPCCAIDLWNFRVGKTLWYSERTGLCDAFGLQSTVHYAGLRGLDLSALAIDCNPRFRRELEKYTRWICQVMEWVWRTRNRSTRIHRLCHNPALISQKQMASNSFPGPFSPSNAVSWLQLLFPLAQ